MNERVLAIDGEYLHIMPAQSGKTMFEGQGKTTTVHFSNVVGCKVTRRHPTNFKVCLDARCILASILMLRRSSFIKPQKLINATILKQGVPMKLPRLSMRLRKASPRTITFEAGRQG
jgi:SAPK-interacting protein 1 (Sin1), Pleckstrin-homology